MPQRRRTFPALLVLSAASAMVLAPSPATNGTASATSQGVHAVDLFQETFEDDAPWSNWASQVQVRPNGGYGDSQNAMATYNLVRGTDGNGSNRIVRNIQFANDVSATTTLNYRIKFENDFTTTMGGKFLGLGPTNFVTGGRNTRPDGWSVRVVMTDRVPTIYVYDQDRSSPFGRKINPLVTTALPRNQWHSISLYVRLNSAGDANDGLIELYVNQEKRAEYRNVRLRGVTTADTRANTLLFHTFFGGTSVGEPIGTAHARYDDIYVRVGRTIR